MNLIARSISRDVAKVQSKPAPPPCCICYGTGLLVNPGDLSPALDFKNNTILCMEPDCAVGAAQFMEWQRQRQSSQTSSQSAALAHVHALPSR